MLENVKAWKEVLSLISEGYQFQISTSLRGKHLIILRHSRNGNRIQILATNKEFWVSKKTGKKWEIIKHERG